MSGPGRAPATHAEEVALLAELEALDKESLRRDRFTEWVPHKPHAKQREFLGLECLEGLFGGAAGGGKSDALLMTALQYADKPKYAALILRRTFKDLNLPGAIMARSHEWLRGTRASWSEKDKTWTFPSGATLTFGYLDTEQDKYRYQGAELQFLGLDEATQFPEGWYRYLLSRLRRPKGSDIPIRARLGSNPGGIGHAWVYNRFVESNDPQRVFVPSLLTDNPYLDQEEYRKSLSLLDTTTRRQLEDGVWVQDASGLVYRKPATLSNRPQAMPEDWAYLLGIDFGIKDATAYVVLGWRKNDRTVYVLESFKQSGMTVTEAAEKVQELQAQYPFSQVIGDLGGMGKAFGEEFQRRWGIPIEAAQKTNKRGYIGLLNGAIERKELVVVEPTNTALLKENAELPWKNELHQQEADGFENHLCFVAGTLVETSQGPVAIEHIRPGCLVWTREGLREVLSSAETQEASTYELRTEFGRTLRGTADHPVFTGRGQVPLSKLTPGSMLYAWESTEAPKPSNSTAFSIEGTLNQETDPSGCITRPKKGRGCIEISGLSTTAQSPLDTTSTTLTKTLSITGRRISQSCPLASTCRTTCSALLGLSNLEKTSELPKTTPPCGTPPSREEPGTPSMLKQVGGVENRQSTSASCVPGCSRLKSLQKCVAQSASRASEGRRGQTMSKSLALSAVGSSSGTSTRKGVAAQDRVLRVFPTETVEKVYNLKVADVSEYYANGILVSNCDALLYAWRATTAFSQTITAPTLTDPFDVIRKQTAEVWARHEADRVRGKSEDATNEYDMGESFFGYDDF